MKNKKVRIILISIVILILAGLLIYDQFFTYQIKRINADHVSKIVYILDPNVPSSKMMKKEITDKQDIKDFLSIYQNIRFYKDILKGRPV